LVVYDPDPVFPDTFYDGHTLIWRPIVDDKELKGTKGLVELLEIASYKYISPL
jgi:hypothetical protein